MEPAKRGEPTDQAGVGLAGERGRPGEVNAAPSRLVPKLCCMQLGGLGVGGRLFALAGLPQQTKSSIIWCVWCVCVCVCVCVFLCVCVCVSNYILILMSPRINRYKCIFIDWHACIYPCVIYVFNLYWYDYICNYVFLYTNVEHTRPARKYLYVYIYASWLT